MDGILVDMLPKWLDEFNNKYGTKYSTDDVTDWGFGSFTAEERKVLFKVLHEDHFLLDVDPIKGAIEAVREIHDAGAKIIVVTAAVTGSRTAVWDKQQWLSQHLSFLGKPNHYAVFAHAKYLVNDPSAVWSVFVDDRDLNLTNAVTKGRYMSAKSLWYMYNKHMEGTELPITLHKTWEELKDSILFELDIVKRLDLHFAGDSA